MPEEYVDLESIGHLINVAMTRHPRPDAEPIPPLQKAKAGKTSASPRKKKPTPTEEALDTREYVDLEGIHDLICKAMGRPRRPESECMPKRDRSERLPPPSEPKPLAPDPYPALPDFEEGRVSPEQLEELIKVTSVLPDDQWEQIARSRRIEEFERELAKERREARASTAAATPPAQPSKPKKNQKPTSAPPG